MEVLHIIRIFRFNVLGLIILYGDEDEDDMSNHKQQIKELNESNALMKCWVN